MSGLPGIPGDRGGAGIPGSGGADGDADANGFLPDGGRKLVEPRGFVLTTALTCGLEPVGFGLAPAGLLLVAAMFLLSTIEWRRLQAANPWLRMTGDHDHRTYEGAIIVRWSGWALLAFIGLWAAAFVLGRSVGPVGWIVPAVIGAVAGPVMHSWVRRRLAQPPAPGDERPRLNPLASGSRND